MKNPSKLLLTYLAAFFLFACGETSNEQLFDSSLLPKRSIEETEKVIEDFIMAEDGAVIEIPEGFYEINTQLILDNKSNVTIKGAGLENTVIFF